MIPGSKNLYYLVENRDSNLDGLNQSHQARPAAIFRKSHVKIDRFDQKSDFYTLLKKFKTKIKVTLIGLVTFFHVKQSVFGNI